MFGEPTSLQSKVFVLLTVVFWYGMIVQNPVMALHHYIFHRWIFYKLFKQLLRNSAFAAFAESSLWPWTWYVAIVTVISQVTGSIWCCHEPRLRSGFDSLLSCHLFDIWVSHSGGAVMWKRRRRWKVFDGHSFQWSTDKPVKGMFKNALGQFT